MRREIAQMAGKGQTGCWERGCGREKKKSRRLATLRPGLPSKTLSNQYKNVSTNIAVSVKKTQQTCRGKRHVAQTDL